MCGCNSWPQRLDRRSNTPPQSYDDGEWYGRDDGDDGGVRRGLQIAMSLW